MRQRCQGARTAREASECPDGRPDRLRERPAPRANRRRCPRNHVPPTPSPAEPRHPHTHPEPQPRRWLRLRRAPHHHVPRSGLQRLLNSEGVLNEARAALCPLGDERAASGGGAVAELSLDLGRHGEARLLRARAAAGGGGRGGGGGGGGRRPGAGAGGCAGALEVENHLQPRGERALGPRAALAEGAGEVWGEREGHVDAGRGHALRFGTLRGEM